MTHRTVPSLARVIVLLSLSLAAGASPSAARERGNGHGSAIVPLFSVQHEALRPGDAVVLGACVTNANADARAELSPGDAFRFDFAEGVVGPCVDVTVSSWDGSLAAGDFTCSSTGASVVLTYTGPGGPWPHGDAACGMVGYEAGLRTGTVRTSADVERDGRFEPPEPAALFLTVGVDVGIEGPPGPIGPEGPTGATGAVGPPGLPGVGQRVLAVSTDVVYASESNPQVAVPGLDVTLTLPDGGDLLVLVDAFGHQECFDVERDGAYVAVELDGVIVASRDLSPDGTGIGQARTKAVCTTWLATDLSPGQHRLRVVVVYAGRAGVGYSSLCVGSRDVDEDQTRMVVLELPPAP